MNATDRALQIVWAAMHQPPVLPRMPCDQCGSYMDVTAEQDERMDRETGHYAVRYICRYCDVDEYTERLGDRPTVVELCCAADGWDGVAHAINCLANTNGPAANGAVVTLEKEEERTDA